MSLSIGIVGLPNVGKSTLFNALTAQQIAAENYPFCTIDPNVGIVPVPEPRLEILANICESKNIVPAVVEFFDIAGIVKGAHQGEGLGNEFLKHIGNTDCIIHVIRDFVDEKVIHVENDVNAIRDKEIIETELILKDLDTVYKQLTGLEKQLRAGRVKQDFVDHVHTLRETLESGKLAMTLSVDPDNLVLFTLRKQLMLLTDKPMIYVLNTRDHLTIQDLDDKRDKLSIPKTAQLIAVDIKLEYELSQLSQLERLEFMNEYGIETTGLEMLIRSAYASLGLISFFTAGKKEVRAWSLVKGSKAPVAAGVIHSDFEDHFIRAEVCSYDDFVKSGGWLKAKEAGKMRLEGKDYIVNEGDVIVFHHS